MDISIVIVNWNVSELLRNAIRSIENSETELQVETIVVDNASCDGSAQMVKDAFPTVRLIANSINLGFAGANNQGMKISTGKYLFILNPDTELQSDTLQKMYNFMENHVDVAMMGPRLLNSDGSLQPSCRRFPSILFALADHLFFSKLFPGTIFNGYMMGDFHYDQIRDVDQVMGAAMFVRKTVADQVGLMDEHNFVWFDEVDWCYQFKSAGKRVLFYPEAALVHHQGKSFKRWKNPFSGIVWLKSRHYFLTKNYGLLSAIIFFILDILFYLAYLAVFIYLIKYFFWRS